MPMINALGALGYGRFGYTTLLTGTGWITGITGSDTLYPESSYAIAIDNAENVIIAGQDQFNSGAGTHDRPVISKLNKTTGAITYNRGLTSTIQDARFNSCVTDSSNNIYSLGSYGTDTGGVEIQGIFLLTKHDVNGTLLWQRTINYQPVGATYYYTGVDLALDSAGNIYFIGNGFSSTGSTTYTTHMVKYSNGGTLQWGRVFNRTGALSNYQYDVAVAVDDAGYIYTTMYNSTINACYVVCTEASGSVIVWQKKLSGISLAGDTAITTDGTYIYIAYSQSTNKLGYIVMDNTGAIVNQHAVVNDGTVGLVGCQVDSSGNVYLLGERVISGVSTAVIYKLDTAGNVIFVNTLSMTINGSASTDMIPSGFAVKNNSMYISTTTVHDIVIFKFANSGLRPGKGYYGFTLNSNAYVFYYAITTVATTSSTVSTSTGDITMGTWAFVNTNLTGLPTIPTFTTATVLL